MINFITLKEKLQEFVFTQSGDTATIWADQKGAQPTKPYIMLRMETFLHIGQDYLGRPDAAGDNKITGNREFTLNIQTFGDNLFGILETLRMALNKPAVLESLTDNGIVFVNTFPIQNLTGLEDTRFLERASMDVMFRIAQEATDEPGFIAIVKDIEAKYYREGQLAQTETFTVDTT